ncbi:regulator of V-ATPase in vacuolar membrane 1 [Fusarium sp. NRRL 52700]|nr:regulator of V-ATPase in vacuolar membrane 1 [Fusarium sp. NRRL 52700]
MSSDFSRQGSNATSPAASMSPAAQRAASPSDDGRSSNASRAPSSQDPYYSNEDIAALHAVVVAAQELLDSAPEPKPLPAAALFKAYDVVLPTYGIDPDSDHHLSTFVFRVGGERGDGNLLDKFQAILGRMGIVLEFGDNTTASLRTSASTSPAVSSSSRRSRAISRQQITPQKGPQNGYTTTGPTVPQSPASPSPSPSVSSPESQPHPQNELQSSETDDDDEEEGAYEEMRKAVVSSAMNRWRSLVASRRAQPAQRIPSFPSIPEEASADVKNFEAQPFEDRPPVTGHQAATSSHVNGLELHTQTSLKDPTDMHTRPVSAQSFMHRPLSVLSNAIRSTTSLIQGNTQQEGHFDEPSRHDDDDKLPQSSVEESPQQLQEPEEPEEPEELDEPEAEPSQHIHIQNPPEVHSPTTVARSNTVTNNEGTIVHHPVTQERTRNTTSQHELPAEEGPLTPEQQIVSEREQSRLLKQAVRAREIYLASKVFNHWADRTARRLERDAVARRHMIRFRYFRSWSQVPALREPTTDHMRAAVVAKKWQRIVAQEKSLQATAIEAARAYEQRRVKRVLDIWVCHRLKHLGRQMTASRSRTRAMSKWLSQASHDKALIQAIQTQTTLRLQVDAIYKWQGMSENESQLYSTARRIGDIQHSFTYLREWWDQAEVSRRAVGYRQRLMIEKANLAFDEWNLRARAQAFQWRREYLQVTRVFDRWFQYAELDADMGRRAEEYYEEQAKSNVVRTFRQFKRGSSQMSRLRDRAQLYLGATKLLQVFDRTIMSRRDQDKQQVKRYLMARYTQVSSARKKRNFFAAIDQWRALATEDRARSDLIQELRTHKDIQKVILITDSWKRQADIDQRRVQEAKLQYAEGWLETWKVYTDNLEQQDTNAWQLWAADKQRQSLKSWSIASLQQSGQGHTAIEVQRKHERERRNRVLQYWRQRDGRIRSMAPGTHPQPQSVPAAWPRGSWRALSGRRSLASRNDRGFDYSSTPLETPTRWTGQPFSMSTMMPPGSMAPLQEADENDEAFSLAGDEEDELPASPSLRPASRGPGQFSGLPSTTPMAPVPSHLERGTQGRDPDFDQDLASTAGPGRPELSRRPIAARSFGIRPPNGRAIGPLPSSPEPNSPAIISKSVGARPSATRFGLPRQTTTTKFTPATRSVRIQSPRILSATPQSRPPGLPRGQLRGRMSTNQ